MSAHEKKKFCGCYNALSAIAVACYIKNAVYVRSWLESAMACKMARRLLSTAVADAQERQTRKKPKAAPSSQRHAPNSPASAASTRPLQRKMTGSCMAGRPARQQPARSRRQPARVEMLDVYAATAADRDFSRSEASIDEGQPIAMASGDSYHSSSSSSHGTVPVAATVMALPAAAVLQLQTACRRAHWGVRCF